MHRVGQGEHPIRDGRGLGLGRGLCPGVVFVGELIAQLFSVRGDGEDSVLTDGRLDRVPVEAGIDLVAALGQIIVAVLVIDMLGGLFDTLKSILSLG